MARPVSPRGSARERLIDAALSLFAEHGFRGTSLQMIADNLGVSKAAVYYQFHSKDEIALAVVQPVLEDIARLVTIAETLSAPEAQREFALTGMIELSVRHRRTTAVFHGDPAVDELVRSHTELDDTIEKLRALLLGPEPDATTRIVISMVTAGIYGAATDPLLTDFTDAELQHTLLDCVQQLVRPAEVPAR